MHRSLRDNGTELLASQRSAPEVTVEEPPREGYTFDIDVIKRPGSRDGRGGRPRGLTSEALQESIGPQVARKACLRLIECCGGLLELVALRLKEALLNMMQSEPDVPAINIP